MSDAPAARTAAVHDLGYKPYEGERRPQSTRHRAIVWNQLAMAWRGWWKMKLLVIGAAMVVVGFSIATYVFAFVTKNPMVQGFLGDSGAPLRMSEFLLPNSISWLASIAFVLGLNVVSAIIADDLRAGAFEFYFSRPIRPRDYVLGKLLGAGLVIGIVVFAGPIVLALVRVGMSAGEGEVVGTLHLIPRAIVAGATATAVFTIVPLALSALASRRRYTIAAWAIFYLIIGTVGVGLAHASGIGALSAIDMKASLMSITYALFDVQIVSRGGDILPPVGVAAGAIAAYCALGLAAIYWRVRRAEKSGLGGG